MLLIRTLARCLVDLDEVQYTKEWVETQIPPIIRKYANHFIEANSKDDMWWTDFVDIETVSKVINIHLCYYLNVTKFSLKGLFLLFYWSLFCSGLTLCIKLGFESTAVNCMDVKYSGSQNLIFLFSKIYTNC